jgi:dTMP kinase
VSPGRGRFVVLEGGEASGKSTQAARLAGCLGARLTREPGGTAVGERLRSLLLDPAIGALDARAEALILLAARAQHVAEVVEPALAAGSDVVCDRYTGSTLAYQGYGRAVDVEQLASLSEWASGGLEADLVVLLRVPPAVVTARLAGRAGAPDRFERQDDGFFARVDAGFAALAAADPDRWRVVDGDGTVDEVARRVLAAVGGPVAGAGR